MGIFGKLFDKKECSVCQGEIGLLGNRKLEDGNLCKQCASKLSPWFEERRHSTVEEIKQQLTYREQNRERAAQFTTSRTMGENWRVLLDEQHRWLTVTNGRNLAADNPDILDYTSITGCRLDIDESRSELTREGPDGKEVSYDPPRYEYHYNFDIILSVTHPYFDEMRFRLNPHWVEVEQVASSGVGGGRLMGVLSTGRFDPTNDHEYRKYEQMGREICEEVRRIQQMAREMPSGQATAAAVENTVAAVEMPQAAPATGPWTCPNCGGDNSGKFCEYCGNARP